VDAGEFERMYDAHAPAIARFALRRARSEQDAEEAVAETFLIAWRRRDDLRGDPLPWLYGVARRVVAHQLRGALPPTLELRSDLPAPADHTTELLALTEAVSRLPAHERDALLLTAWEGLDQRECAKALGCSRVAVALRLRRARARLRADEEQLPSVAPPLVPATAER
jgi:RNA polymerase sigma-70 factor (ECF subfamily)